MTQRRFSFGGQDTDLVNVGVWKFDVSIHLPNRGSCQATCYVKRPTRGEALSALFSMTRESKVLGTGMPLSESEAIAEVGRTMSDGEVLLIDDSGATATQT